MKTTATATSTTAFDLRDSLSRDCKGTIIGANFNTFFVRTSYGIMEYTDDEMNEIYGLGDDDMRWIRRDLKH